MTLAAGSRLGPFEVQAHLGAGGMGEVYRARDTKLNRDVALKVLPEAFVSDPERLARFQREAEVLASLNHPNIAHIYGLEDSGNTTAIVLELVEGPTLSERIARGPIPPDEALDIAKQITEALEAAHSLGIIHRDLKPANVKVTHDGIVKVLDFGLAKALTAGEGADAELSQSPTLTKGTVVGTILGTAAYMSPEQAKGKPVDARTDVWAFGAVLYEMLTGERAFQGDDVSDTLVAVFRDQPDWAKLPDDTPARARHAMRVCLQKDAKDRVRDIAAVRLAMAGAFETALLQPSDATARPEPKLWQRPWAFLLAALVSLVAGGVAGWRMAPEPTQPVSRFVVSTAPAASFRGASDSLELAVSPDGTRVVYSAGDDRELYVRPVNQLEGVARLGGLSGSSNPFFSPDGAWLGFATLSDTSWKKVSILGGPPSTLWDRPGAPRGASWGPNGTIVFAYQGVGTGLFLGSDEGGEPSVLTTPDTDAGEAYHWWPEFLPGGDAVLFQIVKGLTEADQVIAVIDLETNEQTVLVSGGQQPRYASTGHILYGAGGTLFAVAFDRERLEVTGAAVPVVEGVMTKFSGAVNFSLSSTGTLVYASGKTFSSGRTLVWVDREGNEEPVAAEPRDYQEFSLSPDGTRIAFRILDSEGGDVWLYDLARNTSTRLTFDSTQERFPLWSPDGARIAFGSSAEPLSWKSSDGTGDVELLGERTGELPQAFTPDGKTVIFEQRNGERIDIGVLNLDGESSPTMLLDSEFDERNAALSPDGRWLAYESNESGRVEIYVRPFPDVDAGRWQISHSGGSWAIWSPTADELFYRGPKEVMVQTFRTDPVFTPLELTSLFEMEFTGLQSRRMAVSPDGERFLMFTDTLPPADGRSAPEPQIILVENWFEELKERVPVN